MPFRPVALLLLCLHCLAASAVPTSLHLDAAGYVGGGGGDEVWAAAIQAQGTLLVGGQLVSDAGLGSATPLPIALPGHPAGNGAVIRLSADGRNVLAVARVGTRVDDMAVDPQTGAVAVVGSFGLAVLSADLSTLLWSRGTADHADLGRSDRAGAYGSGRRVAIGSDGTVAALFNRNATGNDTHARVFVYDRQGQPVGPLPIIETGFFYNQRYEDIAVDAARRQVIVTGWRQASTNLQAPILIALSYQAGSPDYGQRRWTVFNWWGSAAQTQSLNADSRGARVLLAEDGALYFVGDVHGGDNRFAREALIDGGVTATHPGPNLANRQIDGYTSHAHSQMSGFRGSYVARLDPASGEALHGQFFHVREAGPTSQRRSWRVHALAADPAGRVLFAGAGSFHFPCTATVFASWPATCGGQSLQVNGQPVGGYFGDNPGVVGLEPAFNSRFRLAQFHVDPASGNGGAVPRALVWQGGRVLMALHTERQLATQQPIRPSPQGQSIWFAVWTESGLIFANGFEAD